MIYSLLDNDLYKFTMAQCIYHNFPNVPVEYDLSIRSKDIDLRPFKEEIEREIRQLDSLMLHPTEYNYLRSIRFLSKDFVDWFKLFKFNTTEHIVLTEEDNNLKLTIKGNWLDTIFYEVPLLAIISEVYHSRNGKSGLAVCTENLTEKIEKIKAIGDTFKFAEFGTRRRNSFFMQDHVIEQLVKHVPNNIIGTSNVYFAMKYGIKAIGTMAHEMFMAGQALYPLPIHQKEMLYMWAREFQGDLGCALSDTLGTDYFLKDFTLDLAKLFDGTRQDSGDPYSYGRRIVNHYEKLGIDPKTKYIVFSDNLNIDKAIALYKYFIHNINVSFGIGTNLTNDCGDIPISIVIKMQYCKGIPVVKISDTPEKAMGRDKNYLEFMKEFVTNQTRRKHVKE